MDGETAELNANDLLWTELNGWLFSTPLLKEYIKLTPRSRLCAITVLQNYAQQHTWKNKEIHPAARILCNIKEKDKLHKKPWVLGCFAALLHLDQQETKISFKQTGDLRILPFSLSTLWLHTSAARWISWHVMGCSGARIKCPIPEQGWKVFWSWKSLQKP